MSENTEKYVSVNAQEFVSDLKGSSASIVTAMEKEMKNSPPSSPNPFERFSTPELIMAVSVLFVANPLDHSVRKQALIDVYSALVARASPDYWWSNPESF